MADIITKDSEEFKELTGWIKRTGKKSGGCCGTDTSDDCRRTLSEWR